VCTEQWRADREAAGVCRCPYFHDVVSLESAAGVDCEAWGQRNGYGAGRDIACRETDSKACMPGKGRERERERERERAVRMINLFVRRP
jgi:hypothetical protein